MIAHPRKIILIVLDGLGVGELSDAALYGDEGSNTLSHIASVPGFSIPNLLDWGLGNIGPTKGVETIPHPKAYYGKMAELSAGKDSTTGHWEIAGIITKKAFPTYPNGFPEDIVAAFKAATGVHGILGNIPASGTEIIQKLGDEHVRTGFPILYTSADSVFQIAAHEEVVPIETLYQWCDLARTRVFVGIHEVGRVIARPFIGSGGKYTRTTNRKDFSAQPPGPMMLDVIHESGIRTVGIGKIEDLYAGRGLSAAIHTTSNTDGIRRTIEASSAMTDGFIMTNLVDFDMVYGHRNDAVGFARALEEFDQSLPDIERTLAPGDWLVLTADHGNDPGDQSTDHTREYVPILVRIQGSDAGMSLGIRSTFADVASTVLDAFKIHSPVSESGTSLFSNFVS